MGFANSMKNFWASLTGEDYDYEDTLEQHASASGDVYATASTASTAPAYAPQYTPEPQPTAVPHLSAVPRAVSSAVAIASPETLSTVQEAADHLLHNRALVLNMAKTDADLARRWLDYLSGVAYALDGAVNRIAWNTYLITPCDISIEGSIED